MTKEGSTVKTLDIKLTGGPTDGGPTLSGPTEKGGAIDPGSSNCWNCGSGGISTWGSTSDAPSRSVTVWLASDVSVGCCGSATGVCILEACWALRLEDLRVVSRTEGSSMMVLMSSRTVFMVVVAARDFSAKNNLVVQHHRKLKHKTVVLVYSQY